MDYIRVPTELDIRNVNIPKDTKILKSGVIRTENRQLRPKSEWSQARRLVEGRNNRKLRVQRALS